MRIRGKIVSIIENENSIEVEINGAQNPQEEKCLIKYMEDEGIMDEILAGNTKFATPLPEED
jgi:hypothetical protein